jgi:hypothetical protein
MLYRLAMSLSSFILKCKENIVTKILFFPKCYSDSEEGNGIVGRVITVNFDFRIRFVFGDQRWIPNTEPLLSKTVAQNEGPLISRSLKKMMKT